MSDREENEEKEGLAFDVYQKIGSRGEFLKLHIAQCVEGDLDRETSARLAYNACNVAALALDVVRGRLSMSMLNSLATYKVISQIENLMKVLKESPNDSNIPWLDAAHRHLPFVLRSYNGFVISSTCFDSLVGLSLGDKSCWVDLVFRFNGHKWVCEELDFW